MIDYLSRSEHKVLKSYRAALRQQRPGLTGERGAIPSLMNFLRSAEYRASHILRKIRGR